MTYTVRIAWPNRLYAAWSGALDLEDGAWGPPRGCVRHRVAALQCDSGELRHVDNWRMRQRRPHSRSCPGGLRVGPQLDELRDALRGARVGGLWQHRPWDEDAPIPRVDCAGSMGGGWARQAPQPWRIISTASGGPGVGRRVVERAHHGPMDPSVSPRTRRALHSLAARAESERERDGGDLR